MNNKVLRYILEEAKKGKVEITYINMNKKKTHLWEIQDSKGCTYITVKNNKVIDFIKI